MLSRVRKREISRYMLVDFVVLTLFYRALDNNSAENSASSITFGTVFADTFCKQPHSNIQTKVMKKRTDNFHTRTYIQWSASPTAACLPKAGGNIDH